MRIPRSRTFYIVVAAGALLVLLLANAHLVYVAQRSQPACVDHIKERAGATSPVAYRAARSSC